MQVAANGGVIEYEKIGSGPPLILVHGGEGDLTQWNTVIPMLADEFTVIPYNQRDTGASKVDDDDYTFEDLADDAAALIEALGYERAHVFGDSFGGLLAQAIAIGHPDRVDKLVVSMIGPGKSELVDGKWVMQTRDDEVKAIVMATLAGDPDAGQKLLPLFFSKEALARDPDLPGSLVDVVIHRAPELTARRMNAFYPWTSEGLLDRILSPTLVVAGAGDRILPTDDPWKITTGIPDATLVRLSGVGHAWGFEPGVPERVLPIIKRFLNGRL